ncbi:MAG: hypothetical protein AAF204_00395 [Pseudomonadota bacterium]
MIGPVKTLMAIAVQPVNPVLPHRNIDEETRRRDLKQDWPDGNQTSHTYTVERGPDGPSIKLEPLTTDIDHLIVKV